MEQIITVRGRLNRPRRIDLDEDIVGPITAIQVVIRTAEPKTADRHQDVFEFIRSLPSGTRSKEDIDQQISEERDSWSDR